MTWQESYLDRLYPLSSWRRDGTRFFFDLCNQYCSGKILEVGCGPSNRTSQFLATLGELHGADIDPDATTNIACQTVAVIDQKFPHSDISFDCCVSNYVCEHVTDPAAHFAEIWRVLKPGGYYVFRTPNKYHYTALVSWLTPHWFHLKIANRLRQIDGHDPYPTVYRMNTMNQIKKLTAERFEVEQLDFVEREPSYGMSSRLLFLLFTCYERIVNSTELLRCFRSNLFVVLRKTEKHPS